MNKQLLLICSLLGIGLSACTPNVEQQLASSREATQQLGANLKSTLKSTLQKSGPVEAISVCNIEAPEITAGVSNRNRIEIKRTSLKLRNSHNAPDTWEIKQLDKFLNQIESGTDFGKLEFYEITEEDSGKWFRYMKAIPISEPCLLCHGENIAPTVATKLKEYYPIDMATGYRAGELRGAFTVKIKMK